MSFPKFQTTTTICLTGDEHRPNHNLHTTSGYHPTIYIYTCIYISNTHDTSYWIAGSISIPDVFPCDFFWFTMHPIVWPWPRYGWFQWYCRFFEGRRTDDDARQIKRWLKVCGPSGGVKMVVPDWNFHGFFRKNDVVNPIRFFWDTMKYIFEWDNHEHLWDNPIWPTSFFTIKIKDEGQLGFSQPKIWWLIIDLFFIFGKCSRLMTQPVMAQYVI